MTIDASRRQLRDTLQVRRNTLSTAERIAAAQNVVNSLEQLPEFLTDAQIAGYWAVSGELPLAGIIAGLRARGQHYLLPAISAQRMLRFAPWQIDTVMEINRFGIPEPVCANNQWVEPNALDVVLVPLLGFDRLGNRLGFGGGYYDYSFSFLRERDEPLRPLLVGVGYGVQELPKIDSAPWDVRLDYVATERELIDCWGQGG